MMRRGRARLFSISGSPYIILHRLLRLAILGAIARFPTLSVVSQTRCKIDVFPAFALPITSTRKVIAGNRRPSIVGAVLLSAARAVSLSAVRLRSVRLCAGPIGAVVKAVGQEY